MNLKLHFSDLSSPDLSVDLLAVAAGADFRATLAELDARLGGHLLPLLEEEGFDGKPGSTSSLPTLGGLAARRLLVLGVGDGSARHLRRAAGAAGRAARRLGARSLGLALGGGDAALLAETVAAGNYAYDRNKKECDRKAPLAELTLIGDDGGEQAAARAGIRAARQAWARDLVNAPPEELYPESLADEARTLASIPGVTVEVWDLKRCIAEGCVGIEAVGRGSDREGRLIHIVYRPDNAKTHIALVGKGVTFDSGGLSLKPSASMQTMRCDMGGAATMLAATAAIAELGLPVAVDTFLGAVENLTGPRAYKLGDVIRYPNGVTVEIHNTDAEGRLVLADCLLQASKVAGAKHIVDAATLTGAVVVALGTDFTGLFTDDDALAGALLAASEGTGEGLWRMPLHAPYKKMLAGDWTTLKNVGGRDGGAITAALFLQHFVPEGASWAHLDIAGPAFVEKEHHHYAPGGTGEMVRTLVDWVAAL